MKSQALKRSLFILCLIAIAAIGKAQEINLQTAIDKVGDAQQDDPGKDQRKDLKEALKYVKKAQKHDETKNQAKTWYYTARIQTMIATSPDSATRALVDEPLQKALDAIDKVKEKDKKDDYKRKLVSIKGELSVPAFQEASQAFNKKDYEKAYELFKMAGESRFALMMTAAKRKMKQKEDLDNMREAFRSLEKVDTTAFDALYYAATAAEQVGRMEGKDQEKLDSIALGYYQQLMGTGFYEGDAVLRASEILDRQGKDEKMLELLDKGIERYPENSKLIRKRAQYYIDKGEIKKAEKSLKKAVEKQENDQGLKLILGSIYEQLQKDMKEDSAELASKYFDKASKNYGASIGKDSSNFEALRAYGLLYYNKGANLYKGGGEEAQKEAKEYWKEATPVLEKALDLKNKDENVAKALMKMYARFGKPEKYKAVKKKAGFASGGG